MALQVWKQSSANMVKTVMETQPTLRMREFASGEFGSCVLMVDADTGKLLASHAVQPHVHHAGFAAFHLFRNALHTAPKEHKPFRLATQTIPEANPPREVEKVAWPVM